ncbi:FapA family protein [Anoxybacillus tepidamans]|uniref:FapA family protein n=1 Tax=Anoxybacteroides tepidamans TaxID=265948 RepID=UPI00047F0795|nr:FapA family protein [Anoxybacillus tepidamans]
MKSVIAKGSTVDEAIRLGLAQLQATREEVTIEIVQHEKKRLFGLMSQEAVVKLTKASIEKPPKQEAKVWLKDGKLFYECTALEKPMITKGLGLKLFRNGEEVEGTVTIEEGDEWEVCAEDEERTNAVWDVALDAQKMQAILTIEPAVRRRYALPDYPPAKHIRLQAEVDVQVDQTIAYEDVKDKLQQLHIVYGVKEENIKEALQAKEKVSVIIAEGTPPQEGKNGWIELKIGADQSKKPKMRQDGTVDYRETEVISSAQAGDIVAVIHPPEPGIPGKRITGDPIPARDTFPVHVQLGNGVTMSDDESCLIATQPGRPQVVKRGRSVVVSMIPKLVHRGDVDLSTGNIRFKGDVEIIGNIQDGMEVEAIGSVVVSENVNRAKIQAQQSVYIYRNLINGEVVSGEPKVIIAELTALLGNIREGLTKMMAAIRQLTWQSKLQEHDITLIKRRLLETKFRPLIDAVKQYEAICEEKKERLDESWLQMGKKLHSSLLLDTADVRFPNSLVDLLCGMDELMQPPEQMQPNVIQLSYALHSTIHSSGDVIVSGKGCYNCNIYAGGILTVHGVLRGGEVYAQKGIRVKEAGSSSAVKTVLAVPQGETIHIDRVWEGTVLHIGTKVYKFIEPKRNVCARWDEEAAAIRFDNY